MTLDMLWTHPNSTWLLPTMVQAQPGSTEAGLPAVPPHVPAPALPPYLTAPWAIVAPGAPKGLFQPSQPGVQWAQQPHGTSKEVP